MRVLSRATAVALIAIALAGCSPVVALQPAEFANDPACADVTVRLPADVGGYAARETDAQATGAWGDPPSVVLTCGVAVPGPSELPCILYEGIFWLRDDSDPERTVFTTYGRDPAIRVAIRTDAFLSDGIALDQLTNAVSFLPRNGRECLDTDDTVSGQDLD